MKKIFTSLLIITMLLWSGVGSVFASTYDTTKLEQAYNKIVSYYQSHKTLTSPDEIIAVEALGLEVEKGFDLPDLKSQDFQTISLGDLTKTLISFVLIGEDPTHINGQNLVTILEGYVKEDGSIQDSYGSTTDIWVLFALESVSSSKTQLVANHLANSANDVDGGYWYEYDGTKTSSPDTTGWAIEALSIANKQTYMTNIQKAMDYLETEKKEDASYGMSPSADTQSCVLQGMFVYDKASTLSNEGAAIDKLLEFQLEDGSFKSEIYDEKGPTGDYEFNAYTTMEAARCIGTYKNGSVITKAQKAYQDMKTPVKEEPKKEEIKKEETRQPQEKSTSKKKIVETGDESNMTIIVSVMMVIGGIVVLLRKNNENI